MSSRIEQKFAALAGAKRKGLITFIMGGDPDIATSEKILAALPQAGADIIEVGMPFSDPMADGATIQAAGLRALAAGTKLKDVIALVKNFRKKDNSTPIILMGYYNPVYHYGLQNFCKDANMAGIDGVILVDLPPEEEHEFVSVANGYDIKLIRLVAPTTSDTRLAVLTQNAGGVFILYFDRRNHRNQIGGYGIAERQGSPLEIPDCPSHSGRLRHQNPGAGSTDRTFQRRSGRRFRTGGNHSERPAGRCRGFCQIPESRTG